MRFVLMLLVIGGVAAPASLARAQDGARGAAAVVDDEARDDRVVYKKKTVIDLTGAIIEGELTRPEGSYVVARKVSRFSSLITLRENFVPELLSSADQL